MAEERTEVKELFNEWHLKQKNENMRIKNRQMMGFSILAIVVYSAIFFIPMMFLGTLLNEYDPFWVIMFFVLVPVFLSFFLATAKKTPFPIYEDGIVYPPNRLSNYLRNKKTIIGFREISRLSVK